MPDLAYVQREARNARAAMSSTVREIKHSAIRVVNPVVWCRRHPWITTGSVLGLTAALGCVARRAFRKRPAGQTDGEESTFELPHFVKDFLKSAPSVLLHTVLSRFLAPQPPPDSDAAFDHGRVEQPVME